MLVDHILKRITEFKNVKKQQMQVIFTKKELDKTCFQHDMVWRFERFKKDENILIKF